MNEWMDEYAVTVLYRYWHVFWCTLLLIVGHQWKKDDSRNLTMCGNAEPGSTTSLIDPSTFDGFSIESSYNASNSELLSSLFSKMPLCILHSSSIYLREDSESHGIALRLAIGVAKLTCVWVKTRKPTSNLIQPMAHNSATTTSPTQPLHQLPPVHRLDTRTTS